MSDVGPGHNSGGLSDAQERTLFLQGLKGIKAELSAIAAAKGRLGNHYKRLKADLGLTKRQVDQALKESEMPADELRKNREQHLKMLRWLAHPIGFQENLFDFDGRPAEDQAYEEGIVAYFDGKPCEPTYEAGGPQGQKWIEGWHEGKRRQSAEFLAELEKNNELAKKAAADKPKRGRPKKDKAEESVGGDEIEAVNEDLMDETAEDFA